FVFFFSSRRRHTRCLSDWSSDVCSSDLGRINLGSTESEPQCGGFVAPASWTAATESSESPLWVVVAVWAARFRILSSFSQSGDRSEERRVGKECRARGAE